MKILGIDTSCDETAAAVTEDSKILSNIVWSQASLHAKFGGIYPTLAKREHIKRIDFVIEKALKRALVETKDVDVIAVTAGPCLAPAGEVGIKKAKEISLKLKKPLIAINHLEGHILSPLATPKTRDKKVKINFPAYGLVVSGGNTIFVLIEKIGKYKVLAETHDDALGEALDKAARMIGLGYPGGAILEKMAKEGNPDSYDLPIPMLGREKEGIISYSGLKTAMWKLTEEEKNKNGLTKTQIANLASSFQDRAFKHLTRIVEKMIEKENFGCKQILVGGGVVSNIELRKRLRNLGKKYSLEILFPYSKALCTDNAAMIGIVAHFKTEKKEFVKDVDKLERIPRMLIDKHYKF